jgi:regulator of replication initiation timing
MIESLDYFYRMMTVNKSMECRNCVSKSSETKEMLEMMKRIITENAEIKTENAKIKTENAKIIVEVKQLKERVVELEEFKNKYDNMSHTLSSREVASKADVVAMDFVFPGCRKEVYQIKSLNNLVAFIRNNPNGIKFCETAIQARDKLSSQEKKGIEDRLQELENNYPKLMDSIKLLKGFWEFAHSVLYELNESSKYYEGTNDNIADAVKTCWSFYENVQNKKMFEDRCQTDI